jgi:Ca2+/H+ antiporter
MNRKALVFAGIFLAIAIISPIFVLIVETNAAEQDYINLPNLADETQVTEYLHAINERHTTILIILVIVEVISVILFAVALWFTLKT